MLPALVLTAGLATRLRPLSLVRAKAALPVAGEPLVRRILQQLAGEGVRDAVLNLHHLPHTITRIVGDGSDLGLRVRYSWENPVLGSAGGPRHALPLLSGLGTRATFFIVNGDTLTDAPLGALARAHAGSGALVTMAVVPNEAPEKYGGVLVEDHGIVRGFVRAGSPEPSFHFIGVQVADASAFSGLADNTPWESVGALYPELMKERPGSIRAFRCSARFDDIGTPADYLATSLRLAAEGSGALEPGRGSHVDPTARIRQTIIWDGVVVEPHASLDECVVTDGVRVPAGSSWQRVSLRVADGPLAPNERRVGALAVGAIV